MRKRLLKTLIISALTLTMTASIAFAAPILKKDSHGHDVLVLQQRLQSLGYKINEVDGVFGNEVYRAVLAFQRDNKLTINGIVDAKTWNTLKKAALASTSSTSSTISVNNRTLSASKNKNKKTGAPKVNSSAKEAAPAIITKPATKVPESSPFLDRGNVMSVLASAKKQIGVPYVYGGTTPKGFDCSGFLQYVFAQNGYKIPRLADDQYTLGKRTNSTSQLEKGDLVFFDTDGTGVSHCGIYLGDNQFIHASSSKGIRVDDLNNSYWKLRYYGGKHIVK